METEKKEPLNKEDAKKMKMRIYQKAYYERTKDINRDEKRRRQVELNKNYKKKNPDKLKEYRDKYYKDKKEMFTKKTRTCECCGYAATASNMSRHEKSLKHKIEIERQNLRKLAGEE